MENQKSTDAIIDDLIGQKSIIVRLITTTLVKIIAEPTSDNGAINDLQQLLKLNDTLIFKLKSWED
tara:strand:+ start:1278 stop:1475 length:198 start_codon:yes stop_codon:yes gene_type:complete